MNDLPARDTGVVTFGCLNGIFKVNDPLLDRWGKVLSAVPDSRLLLRAPAGAARQRVLDRFDRFGIDAARVEFVGMLPWPRYWELYHRIDICLDTLPYNGHTTSMDALWMGVPVVTQAGQLPVGRAGVSLLSNLGLTELIGTDSEEYVRIAVGLARDRQRLARLRQELRPRMHRSAIMDAPRFARNLEAAFIQMMS